jgi:hypothetical protein
LVDRCPTKGFAIFPVATHPSTSRAALGCPTPQRIRPRMKSIHWLRDQLPELHLDTKRVIAEDDLVVTHSNLHLKPARPALTAHQEMNRAGSLHFTRPPGSR